MKTSIIKIQKRRRFAEEFKRQLVKEFESGTYSVLELSKLHKIHFQTVYNWIYKYSTVNKSGYRVVELTESSDMKVKDLQKRIEELERIVGQKQIKIEYLEKLIELSSDEFQIDIKKNSNTPQSGGFEKTVQK
jgi:transposase-like protein